MLNSPLEIELSNQTPYIDHFFLYQRIKDIQHFCSMHKNMAA
ncbi:hypothetical protein J699_03319 [Acinetobacter sp. 1000160]|nr:hypothetical protein J522_1228 [Acinetobacter baumannii 146457]EYT15813.1 hypothetical protein J699_03319 [Acinetobacter sp. 1000160]